MGLIERSIRQPVAVAVVVILIVVYGIISVYEVPVQLTRNVRAQVTVEVQGEGEEPAAALEAVAEAPSADATSADATDDEEE